MRGAKRCWRSSRANTKRTATICARRSCTSRGAIGRRRHALGQIEVIDQPSPPMGYARILAELDRSLVLQYPRLWGCTALFRLYTNDARILLEEADAVWKSLPPETSNIERFYCFFMRPLFMSYIGRLDDALALIDEFAEQAGVPSVPTEKFHALHPLHALADDGAPGPPERSRTPSAAWRCRSSKASK